MKRKFLHIWASAIVATALTACQRPDLQEHPRGENIPGSADTNVQIKAECRVEAWDGFEDAQQDYHDNDTKSIINNFYDGAIRNINALVFCYESSGLKFEPNRSRYFEDTSIRLLLDGSKAYKVYFLANCGDGILEQACQLGDSESIIENLRVEYSNFAHNVQNSGLPMICQTEIRAGSASRTIQLVFKRLYSRVAIQVDCSELEYSSYKIKNLRLVNAPKAIYPLADASKIRDTRDACDYSEADAASKQDIVLLNRNNTAYFYVLENVQGELLPDNYDCTAKAPWNLIQNGYGKLLDNNCLTSICMQVSADTPWATYNNIDMQAYLGGNATSDFSIVRNTAYVLTLKLTADQVIRSEWRIEPDRPVKVYDPRMEVKLDTYRDARNMWQPRIRVTCVDCEKISELAGSFLEQTKAQLTVASHHKMNTQFRYLSTWQYMNKRFLENGGALASQPSYVNPQYFSNGSFCDGYYTASCTFVPKEYVRDCQKYDEPLDDGCIFLPGKNDSSVPGDNFHTAINPGIYEPYNLYSEYCDYEGDYNRWVWSYSPESYLSATNDVITEVKISFPKQMAQMVESVYGKTLEDFVSFSYDIREGSPYSESNINKLGARYFRLEFGKH